jgi:hypothetical protein
MWLKNNDLKIENLRNGCNRSLSPAFFESFELLNFAFKIKGYDIIKSSATL